MKQFIAIVIPLDEAREKEKERGGGGNLIGEDRK